MHPTSLCLSRLYFSPFFTQVHPHKTCSLTLSQWCLSTVKLNTSYSQHGAPAQHLRVQLDDCGTGATTAKEDGRTEYVALNVWKASLEQNMHRRRAPLERREEADSGVGWLKGHRWVCFQSISWMSLGSVKVFLRYNVIEHCDRDWQN